MPDGQPARDARAYIAALKWLPAVHASTTEIHHCKMLRVLRCSVPRGAVHFRDARDCSTRAPRGRAPSPRPEAGVNLRKANLAAQFVGSVLGAAGTTAPAAARWGAGYLRLLPAVALLLLPSVGCALCVVREISVREKECDHWGMQGSGI